MSFRSASKTFPDAGCTLVHSLRNVVKLRVSGQTTFKLLVPKLEITSGEQLALIGPSGSGKSTLLDLLALTLKPTEAEAFFFCPPGGKSIDVKDLWLRRQTDDLAGLRRLYMGYVLQTGGLLPYLSVRENIEMPRRLLHMPNDDTIESLVSELGIADQLEKQPQLLSVGERQRVAIARALAHRPSMVLADEPTSSVDPVAATTILDLFFQLAERLGVTSIIASHDWTHLAPLGLRRVDNELIRHEQDAITVSRFWG